MVGLSQRDILIVVDLQNDFCPGGALGVAKGDEVVGAVNRLAARFPHAVLTQDWHKPGHLSFASSHAHRHLAEGARQRTCGRKLGMRRSS